MPDTTGKVVESLRIVTEIRVNPIQMKDAPNQRVLEKSAHGCRVIETMNWSVVDRMTKR